MSGDWRAWWHPRSGGRTGHDVDDVHDTAAAGAAAEVDTGEVAQTRAIIAGAADRLRRGLNEKLPDQRQPRATDIYSAT